MEVARQSLMILALLSVLVLFAIIGPSTSGIRKDITRNLETTSRLLIEGDVSRRMLVSDTHHQNLEKKRVEKRDLAKDHAPKKETSENVPSVPKDYIVTKCSHHCEMVISTKRIASSRYNPTLLLSPFDPDHVIWFSRRTYLPIKLGTDELQYNTLSISRHWEALDDVMIDMATNNLTSNHPSVINEDNHTRFHGEDVRVFRYVNEIWVIYNNPVRPDSPIGGSDTKLHNFRNLMWITKLDVQKGGDRSSMKTRVVALTSNLSSTHIHLRYDGRDYKLNPFSEKNEKNWSPFEYRPIDIQKESILTTTNTITNTTTIVSGTNFTIPTLLHLSSPQAFSPQMLFIYSIVPHRILAIAEDVKEMTSRTATTRMNNIISPVISTPPPPPPPISIIKKTNSNSNSNTNKTLSLSLPKPPTQTQSLSSKERRRLKVSSKQNNHTHNNHNTKHNHNHNAQNNHNHNHNKHNHHDHHQNKPTNVPQPKISHTSIKTQYTMVKTIALTEPHGKNQIPHRWEKKWGRIRGGSPALRLPISGSGKGAGSSRGSGLGMDGYLAFFHSRGNVHSRQVMSYFMGAYVFEAIPPFSITHMSNEPIASPSFYNTSLPWAYKNMDFIVFPTSFEYTPDRTGIYLAYGFQDKEGWMAHLDLRTLLASLAPVESKEIPKKYWHAKDKDKS